MAAALLPVVVSIQPRPTIPSAATAGERIARPATSVMQTTATAAVHRTAPAPLIPLGRGPVWVTQHNVLVPLEPDSHLRIARPSPALAQP